MFHTNRVIFFVFFNGVIHGKKLGTTLNKYVYSIQG